MIASFIAPPFPKKRPTQLASGEPYISVKRVISVLITDFPLLEDTGDYYTRFLLRSDDGRIVLTNALEFHILELSKIPAREDGQKVWRWLKFLASSTEEEFAMLQQTYTELQKPVSRLMEMSADEIVRHQKDAWDRARRDEEARNRLAEARGKAEGKTEIAISMLRDGLAKDMISRHTGFSLDEIDALGKA